ncbi:hypothetical protein U9M48_020505 [Paspalum notatum var. saurae]|uniref:Uncharacterized protein n=1 Tax=Paspalum notatum var. saurae TaxID=547442 RepID=A0AAQ3TEF0_PASNO
MKKLSSCHSSLPAMYALIIVAIAISCSVVHCSKAARTQGSEIKLLLLMATMHACRCCCRSSSRWRPSGHIAADADRRATDKIEAAVLPIGA